MRKLQGWAILCVMLITLSGCATPGQESFNEAQTFLAQNRLEEAIVRLEQAIVKEPDQPEYKKALREAKALLEKKRLEEKKRRADLVLADAVKAESSGNWVQSVKLH